MKEDMTLEEAIHHFLESAKREDEESENWQYGADHMDDPERRRQYQEHADEWRRCAENDRQLVAWLEELRERRRMEGI